MIHNHNLIKETIILDLYIIYQKNQDPCEKSIK